MPYITNNIESEGYLTASTITANTVNITGTSVGYEFSLYRYSADANAGGYLSYKSRGTDSAPSSILSGDTFAVFGGRGYGGTAFTSTSKANISFIALENWSSTNQGNYISFNTTASGSTTRNQIMRLDSTGLNISGTLTATSYSNLPINIFTGGTVTGATIFRNGLTANTIVLSAGTVASGSTDISFASANINNFLEYNIQNTSTLSQAQAGYAATADNGTTTSGFTWMGINNSNFNFPTAYNIGGGNDVSFLGSGNNMYVANANTTKSIIFSTGTALSPFFNERMRITNAGNILIGTSASTNNSLLQVNDNATISGGLSANTVSATTYFNLPTDIRITGGTYTAGTATFINNTGGTFSVTGFSTGGTGASYASYQATPADPASTTSTTGVMMGLAGTITPSATGKILIIIVGDSLNTSNNDGVLVQIRTGTGTAPTNGSALSGTTRGSRITTRNYLLDNQARIPWSLNALVTGLSVGTAYWIDVSLARYLGGTAFINDISISAVELP